MNHNLTHNPAVTILLVEDYRPVLEIVTLLLTSLGYGVVSAASAADAITHVRNHPAEIDIMLTDLMMPGMKGRQLAEIVAEIDPEIKIIFMSGQFPELPSPEMTENFLQKPFGRKELARKIAEVVQQLPSSPSTKDPSPRLQPEFAL
jgi:two-component system cell cycle sensor histidine kinase/response regulator CckA